MSNSLFFLKGKLIINCKGYWYSSGGGKGSFGYFPHLKDENYYPVFPDTQLLGNLKFFIKYAIKNFNLNSELFNKYLRNENSIEKRDLKQSKVLFSDLELNEESKKKWSQKRYKVLPRIKIDLKTRTVKEHMLAHFEASYLEGLTLESNIYLGYLKSKKEIEELKKIIEIAVELIGGLGAYRSRGFGRGKFSLKWDNIHEISYDNNFKTNFNQNFQIILQNLVNFRNKRIIEGRKQNLQTCPYITSLQFKSWLINCYYEIFNSWLDIETINKITFTNIFPSKDGNLFYPAPSTYLISKENKKNVINDILMKDDDDYDETLYLTKPKSLDEKYFVTNDNNPDIFQINFYRHFRNVIDFEKFTTSDDSLFTQEFIKKGNIFSGVIHFKSDINKEIFNKIIFILKNVYPTIGFSIFKPKLKEIEIIDDKSDYFLVVDDIPVTKNILNKDSFINLGYFQSYSTILKRKRRQKITIKPKSILLTKPENFTEKIIPWKGAKIKNVLLINKPEHFEKTLSEKIVKYDKIDLTPSQAGLLRRIKEFYLINKELTKRMLIEYQKKFEQWGHNKPLTLKKEYIENLLQSIEKKEEFLNKIDFYLDSYYYTKFNKKMRGKHG